MSNRPKYDWLAMEILSYLGDAFEKYHWEDNGSRDYREHLILTKKGKRKLNRIAMKAVHDASKLLIKEQRAAGEDNPIQEREEVTGLSTKGTNRNMSNSGFGGGTMARLAAA